MLDVERVHYEEIKATLLDHHKGKFALIQGNELFGTFDTAEIAYAEGVSLFGTAPFLARQIADEAEVVKYPALTLGLL